MARRATFGTVRRLPSGKYQARYTGPDLIRHTGPVTFPTKGDAEGWLAAKRVEVMKGEWSPAPKVHAVTFGEYAEGWLTMRDLKPRTRAHYASLLEHSIVPTFGAVALRGITATSVRHWHASLDANKPTLKSHAYGLLRTILATALADELISTNPCHIRGAGTAKRVVKIKPASLPELELLVAHMPERYQVMTLLAAWCGLRFGELVELRREDVGGGVLHVRRGAVRVGGQVVIGRPKSEAGVRDVHIPPHLVPLLEKHIEGLQQDALLFPGSGGGTLAPSTLYRSFYKARAQAGRPDLRWHDLRHTGAVLAAMTGASLAELMARMGHSTPAAALRYQHAAQGRDAQIADALSRLVASGNLRAT